MRRAGGGDYPPDGARLRRVLCATAGARLMGASLIIGVDSDPVRRAMAKQMRADVALDFTKVDVVDEVKRLTAGYGADVAIEALRRERTDA